jgi:DNA-binding SARP family transcriptional activator
MEFRVLGPLQVAVDGRAITIASRRQRALLALLLVHANHVVGADRILDDLWADETLVSGHDAIVFHVSRLRRALGADGDRIETRDGGYALHVDPGEIDAVRFEQLAAAGHDHLGDDATAAARQLTEALALWRGEPFEDLVELPFTSAEIHRLEELRLRVSEDRFEAELALGHHATVVAELDRFVDREPLRERARASLMLALYRSGRQADALRVMHDGRRILAEELGIDPSPALAALETAILRQDPALLVGTPPMLRTLTATGGPPGGDRAARNPYKGLRPFGEEDAADFFGREALTARLVEGGRWGHRPLLRRDRPRRRGAGQRFHHRHHQGNLLG